MLYICKLSNKLDLNQVIRVSHTGANVIKLFMDQIMNFCDKLDCLSLASLSRIVKCSRVRQEPTQVKHVSGTPL
jgi:hypothetical protein